MTAWHEPGRPTSRRAAAALAVALLVVAIAAIAITSARGAGRPKHPPAPAKAATSRPARYCARGACHRASWWARRALLHYQALRNVRARAAAAERRVERLERQLARRLAAHDGSPEEVIRRVFAPYGEGDAAVEVARCESGGTFDPGAANGQYLGVFQMGENERGTWGFGATVEEQARAALAMFLWTSRNEEGVPWHRWQCRPDGSLGW